MNVNYSDINFSESLRSATEFLTSTLIHNRDEYLERRHGDQELIRHLGQHLLKMASFAEEYPEDVLQEYQIVTARFFNHTLPDWVEYPISESLAEKIGSLDEVTIESILPHVEVV